MPTTETLWNQMGAYNEACILSAAGVYSLILLGKNWKAIGARHGDE